MREDKENLISSAPASSAPQNVLQIDEDDDEDGDEFFGETQAKNSGSPYCDTTTTSYYDTHSSQQYKNTNGKNNSDLLQESSSTTGTVHSTISCVNNNNLRVLNRKRSFTLSLGGVPTRTKRVGQIWLFHWRVLLSMFLTLFSSVGSIILFPIYLKSMTNPNHEVEHHLHHVANLLDGDGIKSGGSGGYSACLALTTLCTLLMILFGLTLKVYHYSAGTTILRPLISWISIGKIGFCNGLCILTIFYAWEDHKVSCNLQDPFLGLVFVFAVITHAVSKWREIGFRRTFALITIIAGIFISVDYTIVDHYKCRGYYYYPSPAKDIWSWQVHLVWSLAFVVSIWLWTVSMFCMESSLPNLKERRHHVGEQYNAVKMKVIRIKRNEGGQSSQSSDILNPNSVDGNQSNPEPDLYQSSTIRQLKTVYSKISYLRVYNATLWFYISTWIIIASLFWTELIPGFGKGTSVAHLPTLFWSGFSFCLTSLSSWLLILCVLIFSQSFAYLLLLIRSPLITIGITCLAFPFVSIWWSFFQINHNILIWTPMVSGELICGFLGIPLIMGGLFFLFRLDVLKLDAQLGASPSSPA